MTRNENGIPIYLLIQARRNEKNSGGAGCLLKDVGQLGQEDCSIEIA